MTTKKDQEEQQESTGNTRQLNSGTPLCPDENIFDNSPKDVQIVTNWGRGSYFIRPSLNVYYNFNIDKKSDATNPAWLAENMFVDFDTHDVMKGCKPISEVKKESFRETFNEINRYSQLQLHEAQTQAEIDEAIQVMECNWSEEPSFLGLGASEITIAESSFCDTVNGYFTKGIIAMRDDFTDDNYKYNQVFNSDEYGKMSLAALKTHEALHTLGLPHPNSDVEADYGRSETESFSRSTTTMTYTNDPFCVRSGNCIESVATNPLTASKSDIKALQALYGKKTDEKDYQIDGTLPQGESIYRTVPSGYSTLNASGINANVEISLGDKTGEVVEKVTHGTYEFSRIKSHKPDGGVSSVTVNHEFSSIDGLNGEMTGDYTRTNYNQTSYLSVTDPASLDTAVAGEACSVLRGNENNNTFHVGGTHTTVKTHFDDTVQGKKIDTIKGVNPDTISKTTIDLRDTSGEQAIDRPYIIQQSDDGSMKFVHKNSATNSEHHVILDGFDGLGLTSCNFEGNPLGGSVSQFNCSDTISCDIDPAKVDFYPPEFGAHVEHIVTNTTDITDAQRKNITNTTDITDGKVGANTALIASGSGVGSFALLAGLAATYLFKRKRTASRNEQSGTREEIPPPTTHEQTPADIESGMKPSTETKTLQRATQSSFQERLQGAASSMMERG